MVPYPGAKSFPHSSSLGLEWPITVMEMGMEMGMKMGMEMEMGMEMGMEWGW